MNRLLFIFLLGVLVASQPACLTSTVTPAPVVSTQASYDGGDATSGVLDAVDGSFVVTPRFRERYNLAIARYGKAWSPEITADYGLISRTDGNYTLTKEGMEKALVMFAWMRMGREASK